jgi:CP family cyanate transporter-like MFS transporter
MMTGAALAGALTVPLAARLGSWQMALAAWAIPAALAAVVWWLVEERGHPEHPRADEPARPPVRLRDLPWRNPHARVLSAYLLFNSIIFYTTLAWLDPSYVAHGATRQEAGLMFAAYSTTPILGALLMPALAQRLRARRSLFALMVLLTTVPLAALAFAPTVLPGLNAAVFGFGAGAGFAMGLALLSEWPVDAAASARMTAMAYSTMYLIAAFGPLAGGALLDVTSSWAVLFAALVVVSLLQLATVVGLRRGVQVR